MALRKTVVLDASPDRPRELMGVAGFASVAVTEPYTLEHAYVRVVRVDVGRSEATGYTEICGPDGTGRICNGETVIFAYDRSPGAAEAVTQAYGAAKAPGGPYAGAEDC